MVRLTVCPLVISADTEMDPSLAGRDLNPGQDLNTGELHLWLHLPAHSNGSEKPPHFDREVFLSRLLRVQTSLITQAQCVGMSVRGMHLWLPRIWAFPLHLAITITSFITLLSRPHPMGQARMHISEMTSG